MHTFSHTKLNVGEVEITRIYYNSDYSGDVKIVDLDEDEVRVPCDALVAFVAELVRSERESALEQMSARELLGIPEEDE